jgi:uncharacterized membrane protein (DUF485 family)
VGGDDHSGGGGRLDWIATALVAVVYLAFMLLVSLRPQWIAASVTDDGFLSRGLLIGAAVAVGTVVVAAVYTWMRNRQSDSVIGSQLHSHVDRSSLTGADSGSDTVVDEAPRR